MAEKVVAVIPARGGSKGIPRKNIKSLAGKPLLAYSVELALQSACVSRVVVSTEDEQIGQIAAACGAEVIPRPPQLAQDDSPTEPVLLQVLQHLEQQQGYRADWMVLLQPTSPLREKDDLEKAWALLRRENADSLLSVCVAHDFLWREQPGSSRVAPINYDYRQRPRRQQMRQYRENGSIYITRRELLLKERCRLGGKIVAYAMAPENSLELDTAWDWWLAEQLIKFRKVKINA